MARCDRCDAAQCMFDFKNCENCGLPSDLFWTKESHARYPDIRSDDAILQDFLDRKDELDENSVYPFILKINGMRRKIGLEELEWKKKEKTMSKIQKFETESSEDLKKQIEDLRE